MSECDAEMLADDIAEVFGRYGIDVAGADVAPELVDLVARVTANAATADEGRWESPNDAARWTSAAAAPSEPVLQSGAAPAMSYLPWHESQGVELGAQGVREHYWRCPVCGTWAGPYEDVLEGKRVGMNHRSDQHDLPATRRREALKAARRVDRRFADRGMNAAAFDEMVGRLGESLPASTTTIHAAVVRIDGIVAGRTSVRYLVDDVVADGLVGTTEMARNVVLEVGGALGCVQWLKDMGL